jgi:hypothetical protein
MKVKKLTKFAISYHNLNYENLSINVIESKDFQSANTSKGDAVGEDGFLPISGRSSIRHVLCIEISRNFESILISRSSLSGYKSISTATHREIAILRARNFWQSRNFTGGEYCHRDSRGFRPEIMKSDDQSAN